MKKQSSGRPLKTGFLNLNNSATENDTTTLHLFTQNQLYFQYLIIVKKFKQIDENPLIIIDLAFFLFCHFSNVLKTLTIHISRLIILS